MMVEALDGVDESVKVGGSLEQGLQRIMNRLNDVSKEYGMKSNIKKTKVMRISKQGGGNANMVLNEERFKHVA